MLLSRTGILANIVTISLSAAQSTEGDAQGTDIGILSATGGTQPYTFTLTDDASGTMQLNGDGVTLETGASAPSVGTNTITVSAGGYSATFTITTVPAAPTLDLPATSDLGVSSTDNITADNTPDIDITFNTTPVAGDLINLYDGGSLLVSHAVTSGEIGVGALSLGLSAFADGSHSLTATHTRSSLVSAASSALAITIDTVVPLLSSLAGVQDGTTDTQANLSVTTDKGEGSIYWIVTTNGTTPTADQIEHGVDAASATPTAVGTIAVASTGAKTSSATGLSTNTYYAFWVQTDVAGNTSAIASASWSQTVVVFTPNAVAFDGTNYLRNSSPTGITNGNKGVLSFWYKPTASDSTNRYIVTGAGTNKWWLENQSNNRILLHIRDTSGADSLILQTNSFDFTAANGWRHVAFAWDNTAAAAQCYVDGVSNLYATKTLTANVTLPYNDDIRVVADFTTSPVVQPACDLSEVYINFNETLDLSTNITKFRNADGSVPSLGASGSLPTGNQPNFYLGGTHDYTNWQNNLGSAGNFTVTGDALASTTAP